MEQIMLVRITKYSWAGRMTQVHHTAGTTPAIYNNFRWTLFVSAVLTQIPLIQKG